VRVGKGPFCTALLRKNRYLTGKLQELIVQWLNLPAGCLMPARLNGCHKKSGADFWGQLRFYSFP
jgi:hypothetical protein